jgi:hypothetical protein
MPTPEVKRIIKAMARAKLREGHTDALDILDAIHADISDHTPLWKNEIADIIREQMPRNTTKPAVQSEMSRLKAELDQLYPKNGKDDGRSAARMKQIQKQLADNAEKLRTGNLKSEPRQKPQYNEDVQKAQVDLERSRNAIKREMKRIEYGNQGKIAKGAKLATSTMRMFILSSPTVFAHLLGASFWRLASSGAEDVIGALWRHVPGVGKYDRAAPVEGGGFQAGAHAAGLKAAFSMNTLRAMKDKVVQGMSDRQALYGKKEFDWAPHPWLEIMGHLHDAIKTPIENYAFAKALTRATNNARAKLERDGMSASDIEKTMVSNSMVSANTGLAYAESLAAKLQGENKFVDAINQNLSRLEKAGTGGALTAAAIRSQMPIMRIPANLFKEGIELQFGIGRALLKMGGTRGKEITGAQADYIMRNLKKGTLGPALLAIGYLGYQSFGGMYREQKKQPNPKLGYNDMKIGDQEISHHWTHSPVGSVLQVGAMLHYVMDEDRKKLTPDGMKLLDAAFQSEGAFAKDLPFLEAVKNFSTVTSGPGGMQRVAGNLARQYTEPAALQWWAKQEDTKNGQTVKRKPRNMTEEMMVGIPGQREQVSRKE